MCKNLVTSVSNSSSILSPIDPHTLSSALHYSSYEIPLISSQISLSDDNDNKSHWQRRLQGNILMENILKVSTDLGSMIISTLATGKDHIYIKSDLMIISSFSSINLEGQSSISAFDELVSTVNRRLESRNGYIYYRCLSNFNEITIELQ